MTLITLSLLLNIIASSGINCDLTAPPAISGETHAHGVVLYVYPRNDVINDHYNGCQLEWFRDGDSFRKLGVTYYRDGAAVVYDNININGDVAYQCEYEAGVLATDSDGRCPAFEQLMKQTYPAGCLSKSAQNTSNSLDPASADCELK